MTNLLFKFGTIAVLACGLIYLSAFFLNPKQLVKSIHNIVLFSFPIPIVVFAIRTLSRKKANTKNKLIISTVLTFLIVISALLLNLWNPANLQTNEVEESYGILKICLYYGLIILLLNSITAVITRGKKLN